MARPLIVAIDGPAGAGKSTVSKILARRLDFALVDTGAIYRAVALVALRRKIALDDDVGLQQVLDSLDVSFHMEGELNHVFVGAEDVSEAIRAPDVSLAASQVSARPVVRAGLLELQRRLARHAPHGAVLEGRDIGTVVFPDADLKVFLFADPTVRARRRFEELFEKGVDKSIDQVLSEQNTRDKNDSERDVAPLKPAADAVLLDSSVLPLSDVVQRIEALVREKQS